MFRYLPLIAAVVAGLHHTDTLAQSSATARFEALQYSLVDLDVADGIQPSVQFYNGDLSTYARLWNADTAHTQEHFQDAMDAPWGPTFVQFTATHGQVTATVNESSSFLDRARSNLASHTYRPTSADYLWARNEARVGFGQVIPFILSPRTEIRFVLPVALDVEIVGGYVNESGNVDRAVAQGGIYFHSQITAQGASSVLRVDGVPTPYSGALMQYGGASDSRVVDLLGSVTNATSEPLDTAVHYWLEAEAWAYVSAVPEPGATSLWISGLLVLAVAARRRLKEHL